MKALTKYIKEGLLSKKISTKTPIRYRPTSKTELQSIIIDLLKKGQTNLNCIDVSGITHMSVLFYEVNKYVRVGDIDISEWDVSNVQNMSYMFSECKYFDSDLSDWDISNVIDMSGMFDSCGNFSCDLENWNVSKSAKTEYMFSGCTKLYRDGIIPTWWK